MAGNNKSTLSFMPQNFLTNNEYEEKKTVKIFSPLRYRPPPQLTCYEEWDIRRGEKLTGKYGNKRRQFWQSRVSAKPGDKRSTICQYGSSWYRYDRRGKDCHVHVVMIEVSKGGNLVTFRMVAGHQILLQLTAVAPFPFSSPRRKTKWIPLFGIWFC